METASQVLHRVTSYFPGRDWDAPFDHPLAVTDFVSNDLDRLPWFYKRYPEDLPRIDLPRDLPATNASAIDVLAGVAEVEQRAIDVEHLARLLYLSAGVVRKVERPYGAFLFRAAGSAGGRFPLELYVTVPAGSPLPEGVHWYDPEAHALHRVGPPPKGGSPALVVTGVPWRTGWRYRERGYRHIYWDAGTMLSQLLGASASAGIGAALHTRIPDTEVERLVGADGIHEYAVAVVALEGRAPGLEASGPAVSGEVDAQPVEFPLITNAREAGRGDSLGAAWATGPAVDSHGGSTDVFEHVVLARGSQRRMDPTRSLPREMVVRSMDIAMRGIEVPHFLVVHAVEGIEPGVYRWPDLSTPVRRGSLREEMYDVTLQQGLGRDAAFVVVSATDVGSLSDVQYRESQLASGLVEGRLHLLAYGQGASASGMTFEDSSIPALLGAPLDGLLFTCVGVPSYRSAPGGRPGAPTEVRMVVPKIEDRED